jgi:hypothetical protein
MPAWDDRGTFGFSVWCDKTVALGGLERLSGGILTPSGLLDAIALIDALVWFDAVIVDASLQAEFPALIADAIWTRPFNSDEYAEIKEGLVETWTNPDIDPHVQDYWRRLFGDQRFQLILYEADLVVDSARDPSEFARSIEVVDLIDLLGRPGNRQMRRELAAFSTARALSGGLIAANLGIFHMPAAVRRGLLGSLDATCQVSTLIQVEPLPNDIRFPSAFGRVATIAEKDGTDVWNAVSNVRLENEPVRKALRKELQDPERLRLKSLRRKLGLIQPDWQGFLGFNFAFVTGGVSRALQPRRVAVVNRLEDAATTLTQSATELCRLAGRDRPVFAAALSDLAGVARRLTA